MAETHINAYKAELAEAEKEVTVAKGRVTALKEQIASMETDQSETTPEAVTPIDDPKAAFAARMKKARADKKAKKAAETE